MTYPASVRGASPGAALSDEISRLPFSQEVIFANLIFPANLDHQNLLSLSVRNINLNKSRGLLDRPRLYELTMLCPVSKRGASLAVALSDEISRLPFRKR